MKWTTRKHGSGKQQQQEKGEYEYEGSIIYSSNKYDLYCLLYAHSQLLQLLEQPSLCNIPPISRALSSALSSQLPLHSSDGQSSLPSTLFPVLFSILSPLDLPSYLPLPFFPFYLPPLSLSLTICPSFLLWLSHFIYSTNFMTFFARNSILKISLEIANWIWNFHKFSTILQQFSVG